MPTVTIRDVPPATRDELASRAARSGRSLQEYLRTTLIELAARPTPDQLVERMRARKAHTGRALGADRIVDLVQGDRR